VLYARTRADEARAEALALLPDVWDAIYGTAPGFLALKAGLRRDGRLQRPRSTHWVWPTEAPDAVAWVNQEAARGREVYQAAHLVTEPRRRKATAAPLSTLYVDLDHATLDHPTVPEPSVIIESSPGRLQCYWRLTAPVPGAAGEALNRRLASALGADRSGWDLTQLLRVPGTRNHKYPDAPLVRLLSLSGRTYNVIELDHRLPAEPDAPRKTVTLQSRPSRAITTEDGRPPVEGLTGRATAIWRGEDVKQTPDGRLDRSASLLRIARVLWGIGVAHDEIIAALAEREVTLGWRKYTDRDDATQQCERIVALVQDAR